MNLRPCSPKWWLYAEIQGGVERELIPARLDFEGDKLDFKWRASQVQPRYGHRQLKPARTCAAGIDVENSIALELSGLVGMSADNDMEAGGCGIQVEGVHIVQNIKQNVAGSRNRAIGERLGPIPFVDVSAHGSYRREFSKSSKNFGLAHVASVKNQLGIAKRFQGLWAQQTVRIGDQPNSRGSCGHRKTLMHVWQFRTHKIL